MNTPLRTSHEPKRGSFPHTTKFWPHSVQYLIRKPTVILGGTDIAPFPQFTLLAGKITQLAPRAVPCAPDNTPESPRFVPATPVSVHLDANPP